MVFKVDEGPTETATRETIKMPKITATFSCGRTITYHGKRDVTAAWAIRKKATGEILNWGFSLDAEKARKTCSRDNARIVSEVHNSTGFETPMAANMLTTERALELFQALKATGYWPPERKATKREIWNAARAEHRRLMKDMRQAVTIEVVATN